MRQAIVSLTTAIMLAMSVGLLAATTVQPSYEMLMAMPSAERQAVLRAMDENSRLRMFRTHVDRWLQENRDRLSARQIALVIEVRKSLTPEQRDSDDLLVLERRMRCELWRSDAIALSLPHRDEMSSSWFNDVRVWVGNCLMPRAIDALF